MAGEVEARLYEKRENNAVRCYLCAHLCSIKEGRKGVCGVREVREGTLYALDYGKLIAQHIDPIEKKPFFHFQPGSASYSIATVGCNFRCLHCQNYEISQMPKESKKILGEYVTAEEVVEAVASTGCRSIAYTYTEPTIFFEFAYDCMKLAKERGIQNVFVTNGYMTRECLDEFKGLLDGANVDVKAFTEGFYKRVCGAKLAPVLESVEYMRELGIWVEVTTLVIPTKNDSEEELREIARWIYRTDSKIPWHISAFYPTYKMNNLPRTPVSTLDRAREIGLEEGLRYVYTGNVPGDPGESTYCYNCKERIIHRYGFTVHENLVRDGKCPHCGSEIDGVEMSGGS